MSDSMISLREKIVWSFFWKWLASSSSTRAILASCSRWTMPGTAGKTLAEPAWLRDFEPLGPKQVAVIDAKTLKISNTIPTAGELDGILLDAKHRRVYAAHDHGRSEDATAPRGSARMPPPDGGRLELPQFAGIEQPPPRARAILSPAGHSTTIDPFCGTAWPQSSC